MSLDRKDFAAFFAAVHQPEPVHASDGSLSAPGGPPQPFHWQERLLDVVLDTGVWPDRIVAPTGAGKTAAIDVHVFAAALTAVSGGPRPPRRLAMVVPRRVLVDDQHRHASRLADLLDPGRDDVLGEVAAILARLRWPAEPPEPGPGRLSSPLIVGRLRGGAVPSRSWRDYPTACAVLCATPDMFGSRLLFRGYGTSSRAWPREAGLLAFDTAVVVDEAHLARQLLTTARRVAQLVAVAEEPVPVPVLQVVETTATPPRGIGTDGAGSGQTSVSVTDADLDEPVLARRLTQPKPVQIVPVQEWPADTPAKRRKVATAIADAVVDVLTSLDRRAELPHTVGCFVNTVAMAVAVADQLRDRRTDGAGLRVVMVCGQTRPADLDRLDQQHPGLLASAGNPDIDVIVTTQSLEVGVDLDLAAVVTELAAGSALAQRVGRANRRGLRGHAPVRVLGNARALTDRAQSGPYQGDDLHDALEWMTRRAADPRGLAPWALREDPPPPAAPRRSLWQRPELADAWHWARTSDDLAAAPELDLWLADSFDDETAVGVVVRDAIPADVTDAVRLLRAMPPEDREVFATPYRTVSAVLTELVRQTQPGGTSGGDAAPAPPMIRIRGEEITVFTAQVDDGRIRVDLRPGDLVVIDSAARVFTRSTAGPEAGFSPPVLIAYDETAGSPRVNADDVSQVITASNPTGQVALRLEPAIWGAHHDTIERLISVFTDDYHASPKRRRHRGLADLLAGLGRALPDTHPWVRMLAEAITLLRRAVTETDIELHQDEAGEIVRLLVLDRRRAGTDEQLRQIRTTSSDPVTLDCHQRDVGVRAAVLGEHLGLHQALVAALSMAGDHHDDGKADPRFQVRLGADPAGPALAKQHPDVNAAEQRRNADASGVPSRWRHEQRSVVESWRAVNAGDSAPHAQLTARLVGTSHGHGRTGFPHTAAELMLSTDPADLRNVAIELFDLGGWDDLVERTHRQWGVWGCAYLEALLRAADGQTSAEGR